MNKRTIPLIIILMTLSTGGMIYLLNAWLQSVKAVQEEQISRSVREVVNHVADELGSYKGASSSGVGSPRTFPNFDGSFDLPRSYSIAQRFTAQELYDKIRAQFVLQKQPKIAFEFGIATNINGFYLGRRSNNFDAWYADSSQHSNYLRPITPPGGSAVENLAAEELLILVIPKERTIVDGQMWDQFALAIIFSIIFLTAFGYTLVIIFRQKKLAQIKNDFINNMTHEFKTPIATISLAVDAIRNSKVQSDPVKLTYFSDIIKEENQRMNRQVETILKAALLDRQEIQLNRKDLDAHGIIQDVADNFMLRLQEKGGSLELRLEPGSPHIYADEVHFSNLVTNLMDNAVKYSKDNVPPKICISTRTDSRRFFLRIEDNGIGMTRETVKRIFEKFYRAHTGNIHNVKGFGLGLSYVKGVVEAHGGHIKADSTLGKGSSFFIDLPLYKDEKD